MNLHLSGILIFCLVGAILSEFKFIRHLVIHNNESTDFSTRDISIVINTMEMSEQGRLASDCSDLVFYDPLETYNLPIWFETGCKQRETVIWFQLRDFVSGSNRTVEMRYGGENENDNNGATRLEFEEGGRFIIISSDNHCNAALGWSLTDGAGEFADHYVQIGPTFGVKVFNSHYHEFSGDIMSSGASSVSGVGITIYGGGSKANFEVLDYDDIGAFLWIRSHTHEYSGIIDHALEGWTQPLGILVVFCSSETLQIPPNYVVMMRNLHSSTVDWAIDSQFVDRTPVSSNTRGFCGSSEHHHSMNMNSSSVSYSSTPFRIEGDIDAATGFLSNPHVHNLRVHDTHPHANNPVHVKMAFVQNNSSSKVAVSEDGMSVFASAVPPLGWSQIDSSFHGRIVVGSNFSLHMQKNGDSRHNHTIPAASDEMFDATRVFLTGGNDGWGISGRHKHSFVGAKTIGDGASSKPSKTVDLLVIERKSSPTVVIGSEMNITTVGVFSSPINLRAILASTLIVFFVLLILLCAIVLAFTIIFCQYGRRKRMLNKFEGIDEMELDILRTEHDSIARVRVKKELFMIDKEELKIVKLVGEGASGSVYKAKYLGQTVALKLFPVRKFRAAFNASSEESDFGEFEKEVNLMMSIQHANLISFVGCCFNPPTIGIVTEFCNTDLTTFIKTNVGKISTTSKIEIALGISMGIDFLHQKNIIHRDLKPDNILLDDKNVPKIIDFGLSRKLSRCEDEELTFAVGTNGFMSPEIVLGKEYSLNTDAFSFGMVLYCLITERRRPYGDQNVNDLRIALNPDVRPKIVEGLYSQNLQAVFRLVRKCWSVEQNERPDFSSIIDNLKGFLEKNKNNVGVDVEGRHGVEMVQGDDEKKLLLENEKLRRETRDLEKEVENLRNRVESSKTNR